MNTLHPKEIINLDAIKKKCIVFDIETCASYPDGRHIDIRTDFENYVKYAKVKWLGMYSYKFDEYNEINVVDTDHETIRNYIAEHDILVGFNCDEFDTPIMYNNSLMPDNKRFMQVDNLVVLGASNAYRHDGLPFKNRGALMGFKFPRNSLRTIAEVMGLETQKGDIDYEIFFKNEWNEEETADIIKYLHADVKATKEMFDKLWDFWLPFTEFLYEDDIRNLSWIKSSIASLTYKAACKTLGVEVTYADKPENAFESMGGRVIEPKYQEARNVWYIDFTSLYPHMYCMFNLFSEIPGMTEEEFWDLECAADLWHGNELFKVKGYYDISDQHILSMDVAEKLKLRVALKDIVENTNENYYCNIEIPEIVKKAFSKLNLSRQLTKEIIDLFKKFIYTLKIFLNSLYGAQRSAIFEQIHTPNGGWDCCWLGQQVQMLTENMFNDFGFETIAGDTDSIFVVLKDELKASNFENEEDYVRHCLSLVIQKIKANVPFPAETFNIDIERYIKYIMWPFDMQPIQDENGNNIKEGNRLVKKLRGKKKNYCYLYDDAEGNTKLKIMGMPIIKDNATKLGKMILEEKIKPMIIENGVAKFDKSEINKILEDYLSKPEGLTNLVVEFNCKAADTYKKESQIQAQISKGYLDGGSGKAYLVKVKDTKRIKAAIESGIIPEVGKTAKYITMQGCIDVGVKLEDVDLTKIQNELMPFIKIKE